MSTPLPISVEMDHVSEEITRIDMVRPSNFHAHLRNDKLRDAVARALMAHWKYLLVMPNTGIIDTLDKMVTYRDELMRIRDDLDFDVTFIMTLYLTSLLTPRVVEKMMALGFPCAVKYYPPSPGVTTGSGHGIPLKDAREALRAMEVLGIRLLGHFESAEDRFGREIPQEYREDYFMRNEFPRLREGYPDLNITIEHATTKTAIDCVKEDNSGKTICGITPQAMLLVREDLDRLTWGVHGKCMPIAKTPEDRDAVREFALSGDWRAHLGDDTAPHPSKKKLVAFKDAFSGCYVPHSPALYVKIFAEHKCLDTRFVDFACYNGPRSWGLPLPDLSERMVLVQSDDDIPEPTPIPGEDDVVIPFGWTNGHDALHPGFKVVD